MIRAYFLIAVLLTSTGCASLTTATHFSKDSPKVYSGTRLDFHANANNEDILREYKDKYGVEPPVFPLIDLPFSFLFDTFILGPIVWPTILYYAVFEE